MTERCCHGSHIISSPGGDNHRGCKELQHGEYSSKHCKSVANEEVNSINLQTVGQGSNPVWNELRKGRITASNFYVVHTRVDSTRKQSTCDTRPLLSRIMGYKAVSPIMQSLKYGRETEPLAKAEFQKMYRSHINVSFHECGIFLDSERAYLAASPDLLVSCSCCWLNLNAHSFQNVLHAFHFVRLG